MVGNPSAVDGVRGGRAFSEARDFARFRRAMLAAVLGLALALGCVLSVAEAAGCKLATVAEWPVRIERNALLVEGAVNGKPARVLLDTGAARTLLFRAAATRFNVARADGRRDRLFGVGGESKVEVAFLDEFRVGDLKRASYRMLIAGDHDFGADVLLGEDFLSMVDVEFDLAHNVVRLFQPHGCDGEALAYWAKGGTSIGEVGFDTFSVSHPQIVLDVAIDGQKISAMVDSGASYSVLDKPAAALLGVTPLTPGVVVVGRNAGLGGKIQPVWNGPFQTFTIGNETIRDIWIPFSELFRDANVSVVGSHVPMKLEGVQQMLIGVDFLRSHRVYIAHSQNRLYFTYNGGQVFGWPRPADAKGDPGPRPDPEPAAAME